MLREWRIDLHVHTCLSPCGDPRMVPTRIAEFARLRELDAVAITDHNSAENVDAVRKAAAGCGLVVIGGMEITTAEEIHMLALFGDDSSLATMQELVHRSLPGRNDPEAFGRQWIVDEEDGVLGESARLLIGATTLSVESVVNEVRRLGGLAIAAHIDRPSFSIVSQLGFVPEGLSLDAVEVSPLHGDVASEYSSGQDCVVTFSDAHRPEDIGRVFTTLVATEPTVAEIRSATTVTDGRRLET